MEMLQSGHVGCVFKRIKGKKHKNILFERIPAVKLPAADGTVLLKPLPPVVAKPIDPKPFRIVTLAEGLTVQLFTDDGVQEPKAPRNDGSAQCSRLHIGHGKGSCVGRRLTF